MTGIANIRFSFALNQARYKAILPWPPEGMLLCRNVFTMA